MHYTQGKYLIVIVDDGSDQPIVEEDLYRQLPDKYPIQIIRMPHNAGITAALNTGLLWIRDFCDTAYIARLDAGDICNPERFYIQVREMQTHSTTLLCGTWCKFKSKTNKVSFLYKTPLDGKAIKKAMYFRNVFIHPTVMFRKDVVTSIGVYPENFPFTEDYAYFWEIIKQGDCFIIPKILTICEINEKGISLTNRKGQIKARMRIVQKIGTNPYCKVLGIIKLYMLLMIPKSLILKLKQMFR